MILFVSKQNVLKRKILVTVSENMFLCQILYNFLMINLFGKLKERNIRLVGVQHLSFSCNLTGAFNHVLYTNSCGSEELNFIGLPP